MNIVINRMKELETENSELTAINSKLWRENEILESMFKLSVCELQETKEEKERLEKEIERLKRLAEEKKAECKWLDELVRRYINDLCTANDKLESVKDYVNKTL